MGQSLQLPGGGSIDLDKFNEMAYEEKYALIQKAFNEISGDSDIKGVLFNPNTKETINISEIIGTPAEVHAIDAIIKAMENNEIMSSVVKSGEADDVLERIRNGTATEEEKAIGALLEQEKSEYSESSMVVQNMANIIVNVAQYTEKKRNYQSKVGEYFIPLLSIFSLQGLLTKGTILNRYVNNPEVSDQVITMLGQDIMDTWKKTASFVPDNITLAMALVTQIIELTATIPVDPIDEIARLIGQATDSTLGFEIEEGPRPANGSNDGPSNTVKPHVYSGEDQEMRDILRD